MLARARFILEIALASVACAGPMKPSVLPTLSELPDDPQKRNERLDTAQERPAPETRKPLSPTARKVETVAATAAAIAGFLLSTSPNTTIGVAAPFDENLLIDPNHPKKKGSKTEGGEDEAAEKKKKEEASGSKTPPPELVPWIKVRPEAVP